MFDDDGAKPPKTSFGGVARPDTPKGVCPVLSADASILLTKTIDYAKPDNRTDVWGVVLRDPPGTYLLDEQADGVRLLLRLSEGEPGEVALESVDLWGLLAELEAI